MKTETYVFHIQALRLLQIQAQALEVQTVSACVGLAASGWHAGVLQPPYIVAPVGLCSLSRHGIEMAQRRKNECPVISPAVLSLSLSLFSRMELISACWNTKMT